MLTLCTECGSPLIDGSQDCCTQDCSSNMQACRQRTHRRDIQPLINGGPVDDPRFSQDCFSHDWAFNARDGRQRTHRRPFKPVDEPPSPEHHGLHFAEEDTRIFVPVGGPPRPTPKPSEHDLVKRQMVSATYYSGHDDPNDANEPYMKTKTGDLYWGDLRGSNTTSWICDGLGPPYFNGCHDFRLPIDTWTPSPEEPTRPYRVSLNSMVVTAREVAVSTVASATAIPTMG